MLEDGERSDKGEKKVDGGVERWGVHEEERDDGKGLVEEGCA